MRLRGAYRVRIVCRTEFLHSIYDAVVQRPPRKVESVALGDRTGISVPLRVCLGEMVPLRVVGVGRKGGLALRQFPLSIPIQPKTRGGAHLLEVLQELVPVPTWVA